MKVTEFYRTEVKALSLHERFQLAKLILNDLPDESVVDVNSEWTDEDLEEFAAASWRHIDNALGESSDG